MSMQANVLDYEPDLALFVSDTDPLIFYKKIGELALLALDEGGALFFEINEYLGAETTEMLARLGYNNIQSYKDIYGKDRMLKAML
jgi:release factor glutamine methyltransferase